VSLSQDEFEATVNASESYWVMGASWKAAFFEVSPCPDSCSVLGDGIIFPVERLK